MSPDLLLFYKFASLKGASTWEDLLKKWFRYLGVDVSNVPSSDNIKNQKGYQWLIQKIMSSLSI